MNKIKENSINKQEIITGNIDAHRANIQAFIKAARTYGVPDKYLFEAGDKIFKFLLMNPPGPLKILAFLTLPHNTVWDYPEESLLLDFIKL